MNLKKRVENNLRSKYPKNLLHFQKKKKKKKSMHESIYDIFQFNMTFPS